MEKRVLTDALKSAARHGGFQLAGVCPAVAPPGISRFQKWLELGHAGEMEYLPRRAAAYAHPHSVLDGARSILMLGMSYRTADPAGVRASEGRVSRYAWGPEDYHDVVHARLKQLVARLRELAPQAKARGVVDTAPLLEREFAQLAGLGWIGKNTLLLNRQAGSWFFLAALLTDLELAYDEPYAADHCGTCRACLEACPTEAFPQPYVLEATRCISYLTIELRGQIPPKLRSGIGDWLFGCDICQDVCPWNQRVPRSDEPSFHPDPDRNPLDLGRLFSLSDQEFRELFRKTPLWRPRRRGLLRNAAVVLGNQRPAGGAELLIHGLQDTEPLVRAACVWALGRYDNQLARQALEKARSIERDELVQEEIQLALVAGRE